MTSNSRRSSWTTQQPKDRPQCSTPRPEVEGALRSSSYLRAPPQQEPPCSQAPLPPLVSNPNTGDKGKDKGKGKGKNNGSGNISGNNSRGAPAWPSFYNSSSSTISMWLGIHPLLQQPARPPQHALLAPPAYYGAPGGPSFAPLPATPPHQQQAAPLSWSPWMGMWDQQSLVPPTTPPRMSVI
jgi:hypothetical protein